LAPVPVSTNLGLICDRIALAARRANRSPAEIKVMAVTKGVDPARIREAYDAGQRLFGENRVQEFAVKHAELIALGEATFHLIGHLQTNKAARAIELFSAVDSLDSMRLAEKLNSAAEKIGKRLPVLLEVNAGGEAQKTGIQDQQELHRVLEAAPRLASLEIRGLMTVPPYTEDAEGARPYFRRLRQLRDQIASVRWSAVSMYELSMGMSHDFEVAIEEGSTCVRIGTAIFGPRDL
jgi:pyridoxal phosphate enzyme (YggS family)